jgi:predicted DCC family thiol-disulfide oxidoreductase YuxK
VGTGFAGDRDASADRASLVAARLDSDARAPHVHVGGAWTTREGAGMPQDRLVVWYNTRCPVCNAGINRQRNKLLAAVQAGTIEFRDINFAPDALAAHGASLEDIRRRLHATDAQGRLLVGADVAVAVWQRTPGERWLATLLGNPVVRPFTRFVYDRFADLLYAWNRRKGHW